jgi:hypothetical protein
MTERNAAHLIRASRGPILLMTLGLLLALHQATGLSFNQTFPVLIIVFGLMWLLERMVPRPVQVDSFPAPLPSFPSAHLPDPLHVDREVYGIPRSAAPPPPPQPPVPPKPPGERLL